MATEKQLAAMTELLKKVNRGRDIVGRLEECSPESLNKVKKVLLIFRGKKAKVDVSSIDTRGIIRYKEFELTQDEILILTECFKGKLAVLEEKFNEGELI